MTRVSSAMYAASSTHGHVCFPVCSFLTFAVVTLVQIQYRVQIPPNCSRVGSGRSMTAHGSESDRRACPCCSLCARMRNAGRSRIANRQMPETQTQSELAPARQTSKLRLRRVLDALLNTRARSRSGKASTVRSSSKRKSARASA